MTAEKENEKLLVRITVPQGLPDRARNAVKHLMEELQAADVAVEPATCQGYQGYQSCELDNFMDEMPT
ncbi:hypothetical protein [Streptomyces olivochromogenes]|uniref:hypothetical protein n=1 Tax=Streptomyces olivochromogenes TaxID=1963 RepID=UPI001F32F771|nr:hypothetical protein [Streptomyces olivochromogenes]MCF3131949.1 hypothetical protein [Streptomyces olivochromogenes]